MSEIRVENIIVETGTDAVKFTKGINVTGIVTATNVSIGSSVTATSFFGSGAGLSGVSAGKILQVVQQHDTNFVRSETTSATFTATTHQVSITPTAASSKILLSFSGDCNTNSADNYMFATIYRSVNGGSFSDIAPYGSGGAGNGFWISQGSGSARIEVPWSIHYMDTPSYSVGNAIIYKLYFRGKGSGSNVEIPSSGGKQPVMCIAQEISA